MTQQIPVDPIWRADDDSETVHQIAPDLAYRRIAIVNVVLYGQASAADWVLIDAGLFGSKGVIRTAAEQRFGANARPSAIVLTHGHFDHVGVVEDLANEWDAPVYAHPLEQPYLDGTRAYPPPDPAAGGGLMTLASPLFPREPVNLGDRLRVLPEDGSVPNMPGWRWLHTPGHAPGHVSLWRAEDRSLIAGDAFITTAQESVYAAATQKPEVHGPPRYFTPDWPAARESIARLAGLEPELAITGHGRSLHGTGLREGLQRLAREFDQVAVPKHVRAREHHRIVG